MRILKVLVVGLGLLIMPSAATFAQTLTPAAPAAAATPQGAALPGLPKLRGAVMDPTGGLMASVDIAILRGVSLVKATKTDATGNFSLDLAPGDYQMAVTAPDFKTYTQTVRVANNMRPLAITLSLEGITSVVEVRGENDREVIVDAASSLDATTITADQIKDLPENEEDLLAYLQMLAGGEGNAQVIIDGFSGGRITRDQIASIVIEPNSFNATGTGPRITITTRNPGPQRWSGNLSFTYRDSALNARTKGTATRTPMQQTQVNTTYSGPVIKGKWGMNINLSRSQSESGNNALRAVTLAGPVNASFISPSTNENIQISNQFYLSQTHQLQVRVNYNRNKNLNSGIGGITLPERASNSKNSNWGVQISDNQTLSSKMTNNFNFEVSRNSNATRPVNNAVAINVLDAFNGGGAQNLTDQHGTRAYLNNSIQWTPTQKLRFQIQWQANYQSNYNYAENNYLGTFTFSSLDDYAAGRPLTFRQTSGNPLAETTHADSNISVQGTYRISPNSSGSLGVQYMVQNHFKDYNNFSPTAQYQIQLPKQKTNISLGVRMTHSNLGVNIYEQLLRGDGTTRQFNTVISNPSYPDPFEDSENITTTGTGNSITVQGPNFETPYQLISQLSVRQQFPKNWMLQTSFQVSRQVHGTRTRNINAPFPGTALDAAFANRLNSTNQAERDAARAELDRLRPFFPLVGNINQYESVGNALSKNLNFQVSMPGTRKFLKTYLSGSFQYRLTWSSDDNGATNVYSVRDDWARNDQRHQFQSSFQVRPFVNANNVNKVGSFTFRVNANSGRAYSITTGKDENFDQAFNDRPTGVKRNSLRGPGAYTVDATWSSPSFTFRKAPKPAAVAAGAAPAGGAPTTISAVDSLIQQAMAAGINPAQIQSLIASLSSQPGFFEGIAGGAASSTTQPTLSNPRMSFSVSVNNLLNHANPSGYSGVLTSPFFGRPQSWSRGRTIALSLSTQF